MASKSVNITISTPLGDLQIYTDPKEQARAEKLIAETPSIMRNAYDRATEKFGNQLLRLVKKCLRTGTPQEEPIGILTLLILLNDMESIPF